MDKYSRLLVIAFFSILTLSVESYLAINYGIYEGEAYWMIIISLISLVGFLSMGHVVSLYLEKRILSRFDLEIPLLASLVTVGIQLFFYLWVFSLVIAHPIFLGRTLEAYAFSLFASFAIPFSIMIYFSKS